MSSQLDDHVARIQQLALDGLNNTAIAQNLTRNGIRASEASVRRFFARHPEIERPNNARIACNSPFKCDKPGAEISGDTAVITSEETDSALHSPEDLLKSYGLDPSEWGYDISLGQREVRDSKGESITLHHMRIKAKKLIPDNPILPARAEGWKPKKAKPYYPVKVEIIPIFADAHAPYQDRGLESCANQWLERWRPSRAYDLGDLVDLPVPSRHRVTKGFDATPQECIDERYNLDRRRVEASPDTDWTVLLGNHDERIQHAIQDKIGLSMSRLGRAGEDIPVYDLAHLLRYDELGIEIVRPDGDYHSVTIEIVPGLVARHGTKAGTHGGAVKAIEKHDCSLAQGHDHKLVVRQHCRYDGNGDPRMIWSLSVSAMCQRDLGYMEDSDTAQGFLTISLHQNGHWQPEMATYHADSQTLLWRDEIYTP